MSGSKANASPLPAHDVPDRTRTEHQVAHLRLNAQDQEFVPVGVRDSGTLGTTAASSARSRSADARGRQPIGPVLAQELREIARNASSAHKTKGKTPAQPFVGGRLLDGPATGIGGKLLSHTPFLDLQTVLRCFSLRQPPDCVFSYPTSRGVRHQPQSHRFSEGAGLPSHGFLLTGIPDEAVSATGFSAPASLPFRGFGGPRRAEGARRLGTRNESMPNGRLIGVAERRQDAGHPNSSFTTAAVPGHPGHVQHVPLDPIVLARLPC